MKIIRSIRFDPDMIKRAEFLGIDINEVCRNAIHDEIVKRNINDMFKSIDAIMLNKKLELIPRSCNCGAEINSESDIERLYNQNTDKLGIFKIRNNEYFSFNCKKCKTTLIQKIVG